LKLLWGSLPIEQLAEVLRDALPIHAELPDAGKARLRIIMAHIRFLMEQRESGKRHRQLQEQLSAIARVAKAGLIRMLV
jgi:hypothetical protein